MSFKLRSVTLCAIPQILEEPDRQYQTGTKIVFTLLSPAVPTAIPGGQFLPLPVLKKEPARTKRERRP